MAVPKLGAGHNDDAIHWQRLKHVQRHVAGAGRHIHEHIIHIVPQGVAPELLHPAADDRPRQMTGSVSCSSSRFTAISCMPVAVVTGTMASPCATARP